MKKVKKNSHSQIIARRKAQNQVAKLAKHIRQRKLTDAIALLQEHGFSGDAARLIVGYMQYGSEVKHGLL